VAALRHLDRRVGHIGVLVGHVLYKEQGEHIVLAKCDASMPPRNSSQDFQRELYNSDFLMGTKDLYGDR
jgi:hypothetical protein